jgi:hypothetical protein
MHNVAALPAFLGIPTGAFAYAQRFHRSGNPAYARFSAATGVTMPLRSGEPTVEVMLHGCRSANGLPW